MKKVSGMLFLSVMQRCLAHNALCYLFLCVQKKNQKKKQSKKVSAIALFSPVLPPCLTHNALGFSSFVSRKNIWKSNQKSKWHCYFRLWCHGVSPKCTGLLLSSCPEKKSKQMQSKKSKCVACRCLLCCAVWPALHPVASPFVSRKKNKK